MIVFIKRSIHCFLGFIFNVVNFIIPINDNKILSIKIDNKKSAILPTKGTENSAGYDISCCQDTLINSKSYKMLDTGISMKIPNGYFGKIECRSSLACKGFSVLGGVIDSDYRGEIKVILMNNGELDYNFKKGDRIAQIIIHKIMNNAIIEIVDNLDDTKRGDGGFGSTGK